MYEYQGPVPPELLNVAPNEPQSYDSTQNYQLDSLNKFKDFSILSKTNNVMNTLATNFLSRENQDYYNWRDKQYIARKYNGSLEQVTLELVLDIILEEEEEEQISY